MDPCYGEMCVDGDVQAVQEVCEKEMLAVVEMTDFEIQSGFLGESHEVQCTVEITDGDT